MNIKIIAVGKIKEQFTYDAIQEYVKRLSKYCSFSIIEVPAEQILDDNAYEKYKLLEAEKILKQIKSADYIITLEINGKQLSSEAFAEKIKEISMNGTNEVVFIIGGANGLDNKISEISNFKLSFSKMTFTHQMARLILVEQIYRAFKILHGENYHR